MSALVIGTVSRLALAVVRGLGIKGVKVYTADSLRFTRCRFSRYSLGHFVYTSPVEDKAAFLDDIRNIIELTGAKVLFPADDEIYYFVSKNVSAFEDITLIPMPDSASIERVRGKRDLWNISEELDILTPWTWFAEDGINNLLGDLKSDAYPLALKPVDRAYGKQIFVADSPYILEELAVKYADSISHGRYMLQGYVEGDHLGAAYLYNCGEAVCGITYRQIHQVPVAGGIPVLTESSHNPEILKIMKKILDHLEWHGICQADFIVENGSGRPYLIDINPRFFSSLFQAIIAGVNFPFLMHRMALKERIETEGFSEGVRNLWIEGEVARIYNYWTGGRHRKKLNIAGACRDIDVIEDTAFKDCLPFLFMPFCFAYKKLRGRMK